MMEPSEVWEYICSNSSSIENAMVLINENEEMGIEIHATITDSVPEIVVTDVEGEMIDSISVTNAIECEEAVEELYEDYIGDSGEEEIIEERETEINAMFEDLLAQLCPDDMGELLPIEYEEILNDVVDHMCEYLYVKHGISVYRPMYLECNNGKKEYYDFPYSEMDLE